MLYALEHIEVVIKNSLRNFLQHFSQLNFFSHFGNLVSIIFFVDFRTYSISQENLEMLLHIKSTISVHQHRLNYTERKLKGYLMYLVSQRCVKLQFNAELSNLSQFLSIFNAKATKPFIADITFIDVFIVLISGV